MLNILGTAEGSEGMKRIQSIVYKSLKIPGASVHLYGKEECRIGRKMGHITVTGESVNEIFSKTKDIIMEFIGPNDDDAINLKQYLTIKPNPVVSIIMGSDSDLSVMKACAEILKEFEVPFELTIVSAHRTPDRMMEFAQLAHIRGIKVIIAAAGGAAHLPGMVAALTPLPVIGVPVALKVLDGVDSLYSIVQMPVSVLINNYNMFYDFSFLFFFFF